MDKRRAVAAAAAAAAGVQVDAELDECVVPPNYTATFVFVHGLDGHKTKTWTSRTRDGQSELWPCQWLPKLFPTVRILLFGYPNGATKLKAGTAYMSMRDRARCFLNLLFAKNVHTKPVIFFGHSMGGLIIKQALFQAHKDATFNDGNPNEQEAKSLKQNVCGVVFLATPHKGSALANLADSLGKLVTGVAVAELMLYADALTTLNTDFMRMSYKVLSFAETIPIISSCVSSLVVPPDSAAVGSPPTHETVLAVDSNHFEICKPAHEGAAVFISLCRFIQDVLPAAPAPAPP